MANLVDITGPLCQTSIFPTVLTVVRLTTAVKWEVLPVLKYSLCGHETAHTLGYTASRGDSRYGTGRSSCLQVQVEFPQLDPVPPSPSWIIKEAADMEVPLCIVTVGVGSSQLNPAPR